MLTSSYRVVDSAFPGDRPFASQPPALEDIIVSISPEQAYRVSTGLVTPSKVLACSSELCDRDFTSLDPFAASIQVAYLYSLVTEHIQCPYFDPEIRNATVAKLDAALQTSAFTLIPPPGKATGEYCGAFSLRTLLVPSSYVMRLTVLTFCTQRTIQPP